MKTNLYYGLRLILRAGWLVFAFRALSDVDALVRWLAR
jgi:hypothetical protein